MIGIRDVRAACALKISAFAVGMLCSATALAQTAAAAPPVADQSGNIAWVLIATVLVLMMCFPGLALFYGGLSREKNSVNAFLQVLAASAIGSLAFLFIGFGFAFQGSGSIIGQFALPSDWIFSTAPVDKLYPTVPVGMFAIFQLAFAAVTIGILLGASAERVSFGFILLFVPLWVLAVYTPVARWVWSEHGWLHTIGAIDFAGGLVVHVCSGFSALALVLMLGKREGFGREPFEPNSPALAAMGAAFLVVGWYGFNAGSALAADGNAIRALITTHVAACAGGAAWLILEFYIRRFTSLIGVLTGVLGALVAITPASGFVTPEAAALIGVLGAGAAYFGAVMLRGMSWYDDAFDVFGVHGTAGVVGSLAVGLLAAPQLAKNASFTAQAIGTLAVAAYAFVATIVVYLVVRVIIKPRVSTEQERDGLDLTYHGEPS
jgi:ammonium transporter, Amt family